MARIETDPNYVTPTFSRATASTDLFKKEDVQGVAAALSTHDHTNGKGLPMTAGSIPNGTITSAMIADATIDTADLKDGAVTSAKILDGTITTADLADGAVTNVKLASDTARANLLTNGGFEWWQRGNGPFTTNGVYTADRWAIANSPGSGIYSATLDSVTVAPKSSRSLKFAYTPGASDNPSIYQGSAISDMAWAKGAQVTLTVQINSSVVNRTRLFWQDGVTGGGTRQYGAYNTTASAWETLSLTFTLSASATQLYVGIQLDAGTNQTLYIDNAMLVTGSVPADYAPLHPADDLARCLRYYERIETTAAAGIAMMHAYTTIGDVGMLSYKGQKAVTPTITYSAPATFSVSNAAGSAIACTAIATHFALLDRAQIAPSVAGGLVAGNASMLAGTSGQTATISIEGNP